MTKSIQPFLASEIEQIYQNAKQFAGITQTLICELCESHERLRDKLDWQPIETAPKDGEEILLRIEDDTLGKSVLMARWAYGIDATGAGEGIEGEEDWRDLYANLIIDPLDKHRRRITGWQPLPKP